MRVHKSDMNRAYREVILTLYLPVICTPNRTKGGIGRGDLERLTISSASYIREFPVKSKWPPIWNLQELQVFWHALRKICVIKDFNHCLTLKNKNFVWKFKNFQKLCLYCMLCSWWNRDRNTSRDKYWIGGLFVW